MRQFKLVVVGVLLCFGVTGCADRGTGRSALNAAPPFGGPETEIVYSYSVKLIPPPGVPDWQSRRVASLPSIHMEKLDERGTFTDDQRSNLAGKGGPTYIELSLNGQSGYVMRRLRAGRYAFVKVIDAAQASGQGLVCHDPAGRPLAPTAVITLSPGSTIYGGHVSMEIALAQSADPEVLEATFSELSVAPAAPDEDFAKMGVTESSVIRQPGALTNCRPWIFPDLINRRLQCSGTTRAQLDEKVKILLNNRSIMESVAKQSKLSLPVDPDRILPCPG